MTHKLYGQISVKRLHGKINKVPSEGSGGPLQAKTAYPSHSEQVIAPDEDYYGLVAVTVKAVPRVPVAAVSISSQGANVVGTAVNLAVGVSISLPSGIEYYYNHEQLPEIPADVVEQYPYIVILRMHDGTWRLYAAKTKFYTETAEDGTISLILPTSVRCRYDYSTAANAWYLANAWDGTSGSIALHGGSNWAVWWSNFDIPNGSADAEEIYFPASTPQAEQPADATHYYYNGVKLPKIPDSLLAANPYAFIVPMLSDGVFSETTYDLIIGPNVWFLLSDGRMINCTTCEYYRYRCEIGDSAWALINTYNDYGGWGSGRQYNVVWANQNILFGSATATDIHVYGTLAVPDPE